MGRPCTCAECKVCGHGKCDCACANGPHLSAIDTYALRQRLKDMPPLQREAFIENLLKDSP